MQTERHNVLGNLNIISITGKWGVVVVGREDRVEGGRERRGGAALGGEGGERGRGGAHKMSKFYSIVFQPQRRTPYE